MNDSFAADSRTSVAELKQVVAEFVAERDWQQFHSPKNLSMAMAIEVAELMEHFQWISMEDSRQLQGDSQKREQVAEELSDVFCYLLAMANELQIDLADSLLAKMQKNRRKYPADEFRGRYGEEDRPRDEKTLPEQRPAG
jgi:NTP pyrophosphatase (non-canonical NTP hydrolase)